jgi:hypothetical protein
MLLNCWAILIFVNLYFIVKITHLMDAVAGRTGAKRVRNAPAGRGRGAAAGGFVFEGYKWLSFVRVGSENGFVWYFIFMALMPAAPRRAAPVTVRLKE